MRALVLSSGGSRGYYHLGALQWLYQEGIQHDILCGTSVGALIASYLSQYPNGQEELAINRLWELFSRINTSDIYVKWRPFGMLHALFRKRSLYNSKPLRTLIDTHIDPLKILDSGKKLRIGATLFNPIYNADIGFSNYKVYTERDPDLREVIKASTALAPFFAPVKLIDGIAADGGIQTVTPIKMAIDAGATSVDVIICYPTHLTYPDHSTLPAAVTDLLYGLDLMVNRLTWLDVNRTLEINALIRAGVSKKREIKLNIIHPATDLDVNSLEFGPTLGQRVHHQGWEDAKLVLK